MQGFRDVALSSPFAGKQRGFGLLEIMLLIAVFGSLATMGYLEWRKRETVQTARQEQAVLSQADAALMTFATVHRRLPCPDTNRDGVENCGSSDQKGWLPSLSLRLAGADPGVEVGQLRYLVQRGAPAYDLASLLDKDDWRPLAYDEDASTFENMRGSAYGGNAILTLPDLCQRLNVAAGTALNGSMAQVNAWPARAVGYALAHPGLGDAQGNNSPFDGVNGSAGNTMEDPARSPVLSTYDDLVFERSFASLQQAFGCEPLIQSINTVALGLDVVEQVDDMREGNIESAKRAVAFASLGAAITAVELTASALEAASDSGNAAAEFAACAASLGLAVNFCSAAPMHVSSAILAGVAGGLNAGSIGANVAAAVMAGNALALADNNSPPGSQTCPVIDVSQALAATLDDLNDAKAELITLEARLLQLTSDLNTAKGAKTSAINDLYAAVRGGGSASALDSAVALVISTADGWSDRVVTYQTAVQNTKHFEDTYNSLVALAIKYNNMLANRTTLIPQLQSDIANLDTQIAALPDGAAKDALRDQRNAKAGELGLLNNPTVLQAERDKAEADRDQAQTDWIAAQAAEALALGQISTTVNSYQGAYSSLNTSTAGPYTITHPTLGFGCTPAAPPAAACPPNSVDTAGHTNNRLRALMGLPPSQSGATAPHEDSVFLKPKKLERELEALTSQVNAGRVRVTDAQTRYDELVAQTNNPPACNITGSPVAPLTPEAAIELLIDADTKGGTR